MTDTKLESTKIKVTLSMGMAGCRKETTIEFEDPMTEEDLDEAAKAWAYNYIDINWERV